MRKIFASLLVVFVLFISCNINIRTGSSSSSSTPSNSSSLYSNFEKTYNKLYTNKTYSYTGSTEILGDSNTVSMSMAMKVEGGVSTMRVYNFKTSSFDRLVIYKNATSSSALKGADGKYVTEETAIDPLDNVQSYIDLNQNYLSIVKENWDSGIVSDQSTTFYIANNGVIGNKNDAIVTVVITPTDFGTQIDITTTYSLESYVIP